MYVDAMVCTYIGNAPPLTVVLCPLFYVSVPVSVCVSLSLSLSHTLSL